MRERKKDNPMGRPLLCVAEGHDGDWEAICLDLDIAVQGDSLDEVRRMMNESVRTYIEDVQKEDSATRARLLHRSVPFKIRLAFVGKLVLYTLFSKRRPHNGLQASFEIPCHA